MVMTVDSSYNSVTRHPMSIFWGFFLTSKIHIPYLPGVLGILWGQALLLRSHGLTPNHGIPHVCTHMSNLGHNTTVMVCLVHLICTPPTISDHLRLHPPTLWCHSNAHCISSHNHTTPVAGLNLDQCLISPDFVPMSRATAYLSFSPYAAFA